MPKEAIAEATTPAAIIEMADREIAALNEEYKAFPARFSDLVDLNDSEGLMNLQRRRDIIPFLVRSQQIRKLRAQVAEVRPRISAAEEAHGQAGHGVEVSQIAFNAAKTDLDVAKEQFNNTYLVLGDIKNELMRLERELAAVEAQPSAPTK